MTDHTRQLSELTSIKLSEQDVRRLRYLAETSLRHVAKQGGLALTDTAPMVEAILDGITTHWLSLELHDSIKALPGRICAKLRHALEHEAALTCRLTPATGVVSRREKPTGTPKSSYFRLNLTIPDELDAKLTELGHKARQNGGARLRKTEILRALVRLLLELPVDVRGVKDEEELLDRLRRAAGVARK